MRRNLFTSGLQKHQSRKRQATQRKVRRRRLCSQMEQLEVRRLLTAEIEPNDDIAVATTLPADEVMEGALSSARDVDFFVTTLATGERLRIDTSNQNAARFEPTLPPTVQVLDPNGDLVGATSDGRDVSFIAGIPGDYGIRISAPNAFGTFVGEYAMQTTVSAAPGLTETEPNNIRANANVATLGRPFVSTIADVGDSDIFEVPVQQNDVITVALAGHPDSAPQITLTDANGRTIARDSSGLGLAATAARTESLFVSFSSNAVNGASDYAAVIDVVSDSSIAEERGNGFETATQFESTELTETRVGSIESINDVDVFSFEIDDIEFLRFNLEFSGSERIVETNKELRIYNSSGQLVVHSSNGVINTRPTDAIRPGTYFLEVRATAPSGTGVYALTYTTAHDISLQRDNALHFTDFDSMEPYLGFDRMAAYADPAAIPFLMGMLDARYGTYEVDVTRTRPVDGVERVASGIGDFGDIGAGGFGGGGRGSRSSQGNTVNALTGENVTQFGYHGAPLVNHEFGHATGLPHARDPQALMSYVGTTNLLPVGDTFAFQGTDSRVPGLSVYDVRNYLDYALQPGAMLYEPVRETDLDGTIPVDLNEFLDETRIDYEPTQSLDTGERPFYSAAGDFNGDGTLDLAVASDVDNTIDIYLINNGVLSAPQTVPAVGDMGSWTDALAVADFNADGDDDLAVVSFFDSRMTILISNGDGTFATGVNHALSGRPNTVRSADIDGDDDSDLIVSGNLGQIAAVFTNAGDGTFTQSSTVPVGRNTTGLDVGDINGDGNVDFVTSNADSGDVTVVTGTSTGEFRSFGSIRVAGDRPDAVVLADLNNDGVQDVAVANRDSKDVEVFLGIGNGRFSPMPDSFDLRVNPWNLEAADVNGDGNMDLLAGSNTYSAQLLLGRGDGTFSRNVSLESGNSESSTTVADFDGDGRQEIAVTTRFSDRVSILDQVTDNPRNDRVVVYGAFDGSITGNAEPDLYRIDVAAGERFTFDIDSAEFQYGLDSTLRIFNSTGQLLASSDDALDLNSGIRSVDPFIDHTFTGSGQVIIEVDGKLASTGDYRLKVTPDRAIDSDGPRVLAAFPDNNATINGTSQLVFFMDDLLDPATLGSDQITVTGAVTGVVPGTARFNPFDSVLVWTADSQLPVDSYTVTLNGDAGGITDLSGNLLDGNISPNFAFPQISGDMRPGGSFTTAFSVDAVDSLPARVTSANYLRDPYNRGRFTLRLNDALSNVQVHGADFTLRGAGSDNRLGTLDDTLQPLDPVLDPIRSRNFATLHLYSRGIPDSDLYRIEASLIDAAGHRVRLFEEVAVGQVVPAEALFTDAAATTTGLTGSFVNQSLRNYSQQDDWRVSQTISGTRVDSQVDFGRGEFGVRADVGITGGVDDDNWDDFSVQWDGWIQIPAGGASLVTRSDDGSRFWVDQNGDGAFDPLTEFFDNGWGTGHGVQQGDFTPLLPEGLYQIRVQYEEGGSDEAVHLDWVLPGQPVDSDLFIHGPSVTGTSIPANAQISSNSPSQFDVMFSASIDPATLTTRNFVLRRSDNPTFFDADDELIADTDGLVSWDPTTYTASLNFNEPLRNGYYMVELNGEVGGIANPAGHLLDGEFLNSVVHGNDDPFIWEETPSGNGIQGGDYRSTFIVAQPELSIEILDSGISEFGGQTTALISRNLADVALGLNVSVLISDPTELATQTSITIPAGQDSVTIVLSAIDDNLIDGSQIIRVQAIADGISDGESSIVVTDHEELDLTVLDPFISENGGATELTITRLDSRSPLAITLSNDRPDKLLVPSQAQFSQGQNTIVVPITAVDNSLLDGIQTANITVSSQQTITSSVRLNVTDYEELTLNIIEDSITENGGVATATITRTDPSTNFFAQLSVDQPDQVNLPQSIQFLIGELTSRPFEIRAFDNPFLDGNRSVTVVASGEGYIGSTDVLEITDFEQLELRIDEQELSEFEGRTFGRVVRTDVTGDLTVQISTLSPDLTVPATVQILDGEFVSPAFPIGTIDNEVLDGTRHTSVNVEAIGHISDSESVTITDFEPLEIVAPATVSEGDGTARITVRRPSPGPETVIELTSSNRVVLTTPTEVTIPAGARTISFDANIANNDLVFPNASSMVSATSTVYVDDQVTIAITEDDTPELELSISETEIRENGTAIGRVTRNTRSAVTVLLSSTLPGQIVMPPTLRFNRGARFVEFEVQAVDDSVAEATLTTSISATAAGHPNVSKELTIVDDDIPAFSFVDVVPGLSVSESGNDTAIGVVLDVVPQSDVVISLTAQESDEFSFSPASITFTPQNWDQVQNVVVSANDDLTVEPNRQYEITASVEVDESDVEFASIVSKSFSVTVIDDDRAGINLQTTDGATIVNELGVSDNFLLTLDSQPESTVTLLVDGSSVPEIDFTPSTLTFTPENWDQSQTVAVTTPLDFDSDRNTIGSVFIKVDPSTTAEGYTDIGDRILAAVHVDSVLNDLRVRREGNEVVLRDESTGEKLRGTAVGATAAELTIVTGSRGETVIVEPIDGVEQLSLDTAGGDDTINLDNYAFRQVDGGDGFDTVKPQPSTPLDLTDPNIVQLRNIEQIDLSTEGAQSLELDFNSLIAITGNENVLGVRTTTDDQFSVGDGWEFETPGFVNGLPTHQLTQQGARLNINSGSLWQNPILPQDVDFNQTVSPFDALLIINLLAEYTEEFLPSTYDLETIAYYDVNNDLRVSPFDALLVLNFLSDQIPTPSAQAELTAVSPLDSNQDTSDRSTVASEIESTIVSVSPKQSNESWSQDDVDAGLIQWLENDTSDVEDETTLDAFVESQLV